MTRHSLPIGIAAILILALAAAGCVTKPSPPTSFYMLAPLAPEPTKMSAEAGAHKARIGVETVKVPAYLDRNQIVTNLDDTEFRLADFNHWAEPLSDTLTRVVAENLSRMLSDESADVFPAARPIPFDYTVDIEVLRLDGKMGDQATLVARWALFGPEGRELILVRRSQYREAVGADSYEALVAAYNRLVESLCRDVAEAVKNEMADR